MCMCARACVRVADGGCTGSTSVIRYEKNDDGECCACVCVCVYNIYIYSNVLHKNGLRKQRIWIINSRGRVCVCV